MRIETKTLRAYEKNLRIYERQKDITVQQTKRMIETWLGFIRNRGLNSFVDSSEDDVVGYIVHRRNDGLNDRSIKRELSVLGKFYSYVEMHLGVTCSTFKSLPKMCAPIPKEAEYLTPAEYEVLLAECDQSTPMGVRNYILIFLMLTTGMRVRETLNLTWEQVDFTEKRILVNGKGGKQRYALLTDTVVALLHKLNTDEERTDADFVFHCYGMNGQCQSDPFKRVYTQSPFDESLKIIAKKAGINKSVNGKMMRHTFATDLYEAGVEYDDIKELLGHERRMESTVYIHVSTEMMRKELEKGNGTTTFTGFIHE